VGKLITPEPTYTYMVVDNTVYCDEMGVRKQLTMDGWAAQALTTASNITKGVVAYECLLMANHDYNDEFSRVEQRVIDDEDELIGALDDMVSSRVSNAKQTLVDDCEYDDPHERVDADIYIVESLVEELPQRYVGDEIAESVAYVVASPWSSRYDRLADVQDLITYRDSNELPDEASDFVRDIVSGESQRWDVNALHDIVTDDEDWWESDDVVPPELVKRGTEIPKSSTRRLPPVKTAWANMGINGIDYEDATESLKTFFGDYETDSPIDNMLEELVKDGYVEEPVDTDEDGTEMTTWDL